MIWTDELLNQLAEDASDQINTDVPSIYFKFYLATTAGTSVYVLPDTVKSILRVTWLGKRLDPVNWDDLRILTPGTAYADPTDKIETSQSRPQWYALHPTDIRAIRLYPTPDQSFITTGDPYSQTVNELRCCISCYRNIDTSNVLFDLPTYIARRTRKAYILWKAFEKDGPGQDRIAAAYYKKKYDFLIANFTLINSSCFLSKRPALSGGPSDIDDFRYPKPILPANFERIIY